MRYLFDLLDEGISESRADELHRAMDNLHLAVSRLDNHNHKLFFSKGLQKRLADFAKAEGLRNVVPAPLNLYVKNFYDKETKQPWCVVVTGDLVEFYDARYEHTDYGQFVSRYHVKTILEHTTGVGLDLYGGEPSWKVSGPTMDRIVKWLKEDLV